MGDKVHGMQTKILEATGVYQPFEGGHNHMVDHLHQLADGRDDEVCFCNISTYQFPYPLPPPT